jgi:two-component system sensor kinase FixL
MLDTRLRRKAEKLRLLMEHAPTPVFVTDPNGHIQDANVASVNLLGYDIDTLRQMRLSEIVDAEYRDVILVDFEKARTGGETRQREVRLRHRRGHTLPVLFYSGCGKDKAGRPLLFVAEFLDRTALYQATGEADRLRDRLAHAARLGMLGEMVSGIAHEVNQPLAAISNYANACRRMLDAGQTTPTELMDILAKISRQAERAGQVIRSLRAMVRQREHERALLELNPLVEEVAELAQIDLRGSAPRLELELAPGLPRFLGDGVQVQQVLMNLIRNATEAMKESGLGEEVRVVTRQSVDGMVEFCVSDQGPGIAPGVEARLFEPFLTTKSQGMGLGLSICKSIVQAHGGDLTYRRPDEGGAQFLARFPAVPEEEGE